MMTAETGEITLLLSQVRDGNKEALERLIPTVYHELRRLAGHYMRNERPEHTLQATELVHEAYLRLIGGRSCDFVNRAHFFAVAASVMRHLLVDHARARQRLKRGGAAVPLNAAVEAAAVPGADMLALDEALERLARIDPRQSRVVELRYFGGLTIQEIATVMELSERTVKYEWQMARAWLRAEVEQRP